MKITFESKNDFSKLNNWLERSKRPFKTDILNKYGKLGVEALRENTPIDSGKTSECWDYSIDVSNGKAKISFINTNNNDGVNIAILLQYGHGTRNGGWVEGRDYINPALQPIFEELANEVWNEVMEK